MKCPGQDMQYWNAEAIYEVNCPKCGKPVEFYKDDTTRKCSHCEHRFVNPRMDFGCAAYCQYAEQCLGTLPEEFVASQDNLLKDKVAVEMKRYYKTDFKRISHVSRVARYAEKIGKNEGANLAVILCAAYLNNIGLSETEEKHGSIEPLLVKQESLLVATSVLSKLGAKEAVLQDVCSLIESHNSVGESCSPESSVLNDALLAARLEEKHKKSPLAPQSLKKIIEDQFLTSGGRQIAMTTFKNMGVL